MYTNDARAGLIALGANLPSGGLPPEISVPKAMARLVERVGGPHSQSRLFHTPAFPPGSGPQFVNAAVKIEWRGHAGELLALLHEIEEEFGRTRAHRWEARVMDLDLIGLGDAILPDAATRANWANLPPERAAQVVPDQLILPHPRLAERGFVLVPLADIAPEWVDPATGLTVAEMLAARPHAELAGIHPVPVAAE
ncbi:2-amino-4-hydroxy-6-hydroxymethyldihydropteridine diphosphokinase [Jannaschia sp. CCS1]|uniref:2-amino-4-hydroxy-6- hydroxymethyldihydropteridine diphosphokinase n=1 Tax=Jannaschia sp. (strain CCS1) TaxID=290400 RepID=UPI000053CBCE|nr:2-amino-4-hydroxy-6-hydroxymethyldihydropteridine diphosphokinase [Jannaschia sp. CCS1]ABD53429.1 2-amino-4-hydroxy-6-hydroxymethyldihydropteridine pyrophosphokinase [Jannaschia sp. CCS1]